MIAGERALHDVHAIDFIAIRVPWLADGVGHGDPGLGRGQHNGLYGLHEVTSVLTAVRTEPPTIRRGIRRSVPEVVHLNRTEERTCRACFERSARIHLLLDRTPLRVGVNIVLAVVNKR